MEVISVFVRTQSSKSRGVVRLLLGLLFLSTGLMKLFVPELRAAFSGQLVAAAIPAHEISMWFVPLEHIEDSVP